ncbi:MAG: hypothetical protein JKY19_07950 [Alcanivoracaceae bacterium]|nr:hypothetical protein [Alcanivoracaceae bacterium]
MSDKSNEQISNLMDGELEINASKFLLKRMATDESLSNTWDSYHLIKSCLQKESREPLIIDVAGLVCQQLSHKKCSSIKHEIISTPPHIHRWLKPVIGVGIAASVAIMSVFMLQNQQVDGLQSESYINVAQNNVVKPIKTTISANVATSGKIIVPPPSLSRFPSVSAGNSYNYNQDFSHTVNMPYLLIINQKSDNRQLSPMRIKDVSD